MPRKFQYTTIDRIISKIYRDLGLEEISETDLVEWAGEALEAIGSVNLYEESVAFIEVKDYQAELPCGFHAIINIAKNNFWEEDNKTCCTANEIVLDTPVTETPCNSSKCGGDFIFDCRGGLIQEHEQVYYRPYFDLKYEYEGWSKSNMFRQKYTPVRLSNHSFFGSIVCHEDSELYSSCTEEYTLVHDKLKFSFKEGFVAVAYLKQMIDEKTGYPMVPDDYSIITAITMYITMKYMARLYYMGREGYSDKFQKAESDWHWYCKQAGNNSMMLYGIDEHENFLKQRYQLIPKHNRYQGFFGKLNTADYNIKGFNIR